MATIERTFTVENKAGLHARTASLIVQTLGKFQSEVFLSKGSERINGKSIMGVMMLAATQGSRVKVEIDGPDAEETMAALAELFESRFGEE